jgi:hypothetical protein
MKNTLLVNAFQTGKARFAASSDEGIRDVELSRSVEDGTSHTGPTCFCLPEMTT